MADVFAGLLTSNTPSAPTGSNAFAGLLTGNTPTGIAPTISNASPNINPTGNTGIPATALTGSLGGGFGASNITDTQGKPLLTYENPQAMSSQLLSDRTAPTFDPTVAQPISSNVLQNGRMPESVSQAIKAQFPGSTADELDHIMPLELGGSNEHSNLRLEPAANGGQYNAGTNPTNTDPLENALASQVHSGQISLVDAWKQMARAKGIVLPEQGGKVPNMAEKGIQPNTQPNEQNNTKKITDLVALKAFPATMSTLADMQTNPFSTGSSASDILSTPQSDVNKSAVAYGTALKAFHDDMANNAPMSQKISDALQSVTSGAGFVLSPITSLFDAASKIPVVGTVAKLVFNLPFSFVGDVTGDMGSGIVNALPISKQAKQNLEPGVRAIYTLAGQLGAGSAIAPDVLGTLKEQFGAKDAETILTEAQKLAAEKSQQESNTLTTPEPIIGTPTPTFGEDIISGKTDVPVDNFKGLLTKPEIQNSKTVDLTKPQTPVVDIKAPDTRTPMDALADKMNRGTPVQDILPPKTPITANGTDFKVINDNGGDTVKVVNPKTGNEEDIPRTSIEPTTVKVSRAQLPVGEGETKASALASRVMANIDNLPDDTAAEYKVANNKEQIKAAADYVSKNPEDAIEVLKGNKPAPKGLLHTAIYAALQEAGTEDPALAANLASLRLTRAGQEVQFAKNLNPLAPDNFIRQVNESRIESLGREKIKGMQKQETASFDASVKKATSDRLTGKVKVDWASFVESIKC